MTFRFWAEYCFLDANPRLAERQSRRRESTSPVVSQRRKKRKSGCLRHYIPMTVKNRHKL